MGGSICQSSLVNLSQTASEYRGTGERPSLSKGEERSPLGPSGGDGGICRRISAGDLGGGRKDRLLLPNANPSEKLWIERKRTIDDLPFISQ